MLAILVELQLQRGIFAALPCSKTDQIVATGLHDSNPLVDFCTIIQSLALRLSVNRHVVLYIRHYRNAGT